MIPCKHCGQVEEDHFVGEKMWCDPDGHELFLFGRHFEPDVTGTASCFTTTGILDIGSATISGEALWFNGSWPHHFLHGQDPVTLAKQRRWDLHFLTMAKLNSTMSKDPSTQVGAVLVGPDREVISTGFNGFPRKVEDSGERLSDREMKNKLVVHAEMNAVLAAARRGCATKDTVLYLVAQNAVTGTIWGGPPCTRCTVELIQAGITEVVSFPQKTVPSRWHDDITFATSLLKEASITYREVQPE